MSSLKYYEFIDQLCAALGIEDSKSMYDACALRFNGIPFTLVKSETEGEEDSVYIYCDFGEPPAEVKPVVLQRQSV